MGGRKGVMGGGARWEAEGGAKATIRTQAVVLCLQYVT